MISRLVQRLRATGRLTDRSRSRRPRVTTQHQDRRKRLVHLRNRLRTATETAREVIGTHGRRVCPRTVRNRLREFDLRPRRPYVGPNLTPRRRQRRMQWLRAHAPNRFRLADWRRVMFSDESRFSLQLSDRRQRVYRLAIFWRLHTRSRQIWGSGVRNGLGWDFPWGENAPSGYSG